MFGLLRTLSSTHLHTPPSHPGPLHPCLWGVPHAAMAPLIHWDPASAFPLAFTPFLPSSQPWAAPTHTRCALLPAGGCLLWVGGAERGETEADQCNCSTVPSTRDTSWGGGGASPPARLCWGSWTPPSSSFPWGHSCFSKGMLPTGALGLPRVFISHPIFAL